MVSSTLNVGFIKAAFWLGGIITVLCHSTLRSVYVKRWIAPVRTQSLVWPGGPFRRHLSLAAKRLSSPAHAGMLASAVSACPSSFRLVLPGTLLWASGSLPVSCLVNSGADDCFLDEALASQMGLLPVRLAEPRVVRDLDRRVLARSTHRSESVTLLVSGNHREHIQLYQHCIDYRGLNNITIRNRYPHPIMDAVVASLQ